MMHASERVIPSRPQFRYMSSRSVRLVRRLRSMRAIIGYVVRRKLQKRKMFDHIKPPCRKPKGSTKKFDVVNSCIITISTS